MNMSRQPTQLVNSQYERNEDDKYYTEHWLTEVLLRHVKLSRAHDVVFDPAAGRGDIMAPVKALGVKALGNDINPPAKLLPGCESLITKGDYLSPKFVYPAPNVNVIIANPPFGDLAQQFVEKALAAPRVRLVAFLLRCNWNTSPGGRGKTKGSRTRLFQGRGGMPFAYEIVITDRPRWDWWYVSEEESAKNNKPFHSYSWYVWDRDWKGRSTQFFDGREENFL